MKFTWIKGVLWTKWVPRTWCVLLVMGPATALPSNAKLKTVYHIGLLMRAANLRSDSFDQRSGNAEEGVQVAVRLFEEQNPAEIVNIHLLQHRNRLRSFINVAKQLRDWHVQACVGPELSREVNFLADLLYSGRPRDPIVLLSPSASALPNSKGKDWAFTLNVSGQILGKVLSQFVVANMRPSHLGIFKDLSSVSCALSGDVFYNSLSTQLWREDEAARHWIERYTIDGSESYGAHVLEFMRQKIGVVAAFVNAYDFAHLVSLASLHKYFPVYLGTDKWGPNNILYERLVKTTPLGKNFIAYRTYYWNPKTSVPIARSFIARYRRMYGHDPCGRDAIYFDATWVLLHALHGIKHKHNSRELVQALETMHLDLATTPGFYFNVEHYGHRVVYIYRIDQKGVSLSAEYP